MSLAQPKPAPLLLAARAYKRPGTAASIFIPVPDLHHHSSTPHCCHLQTSCGLVSVSFEACHQGPLGQSYLRRARRLEAQPEDEALAHELLDAISSRQPWMASLVNNLRLYDVQSRKEGIVRQCRGYQPLCSCDVKALLLHEHCMSAVDMCRSGLHAPC